MNVLQIVVAPKAKLAVFYNPVDKCIYFEPSNIIGVVEFQDPDGSEMVANVACYLSYDKFGMYTVPQLQPNFINVIDKEEDFSMHLHKAQIEGISKFYKEMEGKLTEVETIEIKNKGNVSFIKNLKKDPPKKPEDNK